MLQRTIRIRTFIVIASFLLSILVLEFLSRIVFPVAQEIRYLGVDGKELNPKQDSLHYRPNMRFHEVCSEFDVEIAINELGYRSPSPQGLPRYVFLGDSFTFGQGVRDDETFVSLYCKSKRVSCANLGREGSGTGTQLDILEWYLVNMGWRPETVVLCPMAMTSALMSGNDLVDNLNYDAMGKTDASDKGDRPGLLAPFIRHRAWLSRNLNLVRIALYMVGPQVRARFTPAVEKAKLAAALDSTAAKLERLDALAKTYGFRYQLVVIHPMQDILWATDKATVDALQKIAPSGIKVVGIGDAFRHNPKSYYFRLNGHPNSKGHAAIARFLERILT